MRFIHASKDASSGVETLMYPGRLSNRPAMSVAP